ncbi:uncharacterized protein LOC125373314 [Haliotis rufescens]|uniref:uncharacterized protein LOC125373314 n=1 Tax=Haliotis rufescens TaxID=6454 RepID=UPI00201F8BD1|nr:uncharacterized protein LOC125373314 [Haliotis rufescens]
MSTKQPGSIRNDKKRRLEDDDSGNIPTNSDSWARFLVIEAADKLPLKLNPFAITKAINGHCGEVKNVTRLGSGSILVECLKKQQSLNLLSISQFANVEVAVSAHKTLNSSRGIVRDRARCLSDMSEQEIVTELKDQAVTAVKRFTKKRCGGKHDSTECREDVKCANCNGQHEAWSKSCPLWKTESQILKLKHHNNISYLDAKKQVANQLPSTLTYSAAVSRSVATSSIECQTELTWVHSVQPVETTSVIQPNKSDCQPTTSSSESQTDPQPLPVIEKPGHVRMSKTERKKRNRQHLRTPSLSEVPVHNSFGPLDMEVTPSSQASARSSSHSRVRLPIEPP